VGDSRNPPQPGRTHHATRHRADGAAKSAIRLQATGFPRSALGHFNTIKELRMANSSATGGYLAPIAISPPLEDAELEALFLGFIAGVSGLPPNMVRTHWPAAGVEPPAQSDTWCLMDIRAQTADAGPVVAHDPAGEGSDSYVRHEDIEVLCSMFGPNALRHAALLRDGAAVPQNREPLLAQGMAVGGAGPILARHELVNQQWIRQFDMTLHFKRRVTRIYPVLNLLSAQVTTHAASLSPTDHINHLAD